MNCREWLAKLVSYDTTSRNSNLELIYCIRSYLTALGVPSTLVYNDEKTKANLWATLAGEGGITDGGIILSGHTDVVPVDGQKWESDPFTLTERDGKFYGRGTCDMKGFIAVCMSLVPELLQMKRRKPIHLAWTYDEEVGCIGGQVLTQFLREQGVKAYGCIVGEPTSNQVVVAHKGIAVYRARVQGKAAHSSYALTRRSCNAIDYAAKLIVKIREIAEDFRCNGTCDSYFDVPNTTISTNLVTGGNAENTVPAVCEFVFEMRYLTNTDLGLIEKQIKTYAEGELLPLMKTEFDCASIEIVKMVGAPPLKQADEEDPFLILLRRIARDNAVRKVAYATEAGHYQGIGIPVGVCGPGSILQAHGANEFVTLEQLEGCAKIIREVAQDGDIGRKPHL
ncbi:acetylornithine deacetylase, putative [Trypanosoma brucei brucei TREU927]|uniref:Acetylornithine deacetylase, putative n=1 Tax=Trypanosoma brucei brucei (strain 927/4 GUTat10.1) TaxID=185431 RepID=Q581Z1_TRYB2|nr:acetylornithine deacetylase, putative [Trypanosoma brucei brucei TREU927]AAX79412.1 acetylornithine deacetylase, putative [Trypanosoma brucei]AAZ12958.1 acetylornithine deacetylase, putative [Trypanosoma brucei brucei TREU927]